MWRVAFWNCHDDSGGVQRGRILMAISSQAQNAQWMTGTHALYPIYPLFHEHQKKKRKGIVQMLPIPPPTKSNQTITSNLQCPGLSMETQCTTWNLLTGRLVTSILARCYLLASFFHDHNHVQSFQSFGLTVFSTIMVFHPCSNTKANRFEKSSPL